MKFGFEAHGVLSDETKDRSALSLLYIWTNDKEEYIMNGLGVILQNASITFCGIYISSSNANSKKISHLNTGT